MKPYSILVVDDEAAQRDILSGYFRKKNFTVYTAENGSAALDVISNRTIDIMLTDMRMPEMTGLELQDRVNSVNPDISVVMMTAFGSIEDAVKAMKNGADDYIQKPIDLSYLDVVMQKILKSKRMMRENRELRAELQERYDFKQIISTSKPMEKVLNIAGRAAQSKASVLLRGESGTGKEVIARAIHFGGPRSNKPFVPVNVAAIPENLFESELFGHEKGAFTGAIAQRRGRFEQADGGTLFIDEIGDIPVSSQVKFLRVLQEKSFSRVGGASNIQVDVRIIAATSQNLEQMLEQGGFREDLFYRMNVVSIHIPPLRERRQDIPLLADHFLRKFAEEEGKSIQTFSREVFDILMKYSYPGNVRELENIVQRSVVMTRSDLITTDDLPPNVMNLPNQPAIPSIGSLEAQVAALEQNLISHALYQAQGNQSRAAETLGMTERKLRYKIKKYGMK